MKQHFRLYLFLSAINLETHNSSYTFFCFQKNCYLTFPPFYEVEKDWTHHQQHVFPLPVDAVHGVHHMPHATCQPLLNALTTTSDQWSCIESNQGRHACGTLITHTHRLLSGSPSGKTHTLAVMRKNCMAACTPFVHFCMCIGLFLFRCMRSFCMFF